MKKAISIILLCAASLLLSQCSRASNQLSPDVTGAFSHPPDAVLYSLDPSRLSPEARVTADSFHGYRVLGATPLDPAQADAALKEITVDAKAWDGDFIKTHSPCFNPRHGLRVKKGGHTFDLLICYECAQVEEYRDDQALAHLYLDVPPTSPYPRALNDVLGAAGIPGPSH